MHTPETGEAFPVADPDGNSLDDGLRGVVALWCLRILVHLGGFDGFLDQRIFRTDSVLKATGLAKRELRDAAPAEAARILRARLAEVEASAPQIEGPLAENLAYAAEVLGLSATDQRILAFAAVIDVDEGLDDAGDTLGHKLTQERFVKSLAVILGAPVAEIQESLAPSGILVASRLCDVCPDSERMAGMLRLLPGFGHALRTPHAVPGELFAHYLRPAGDCHLTPQDFPHLEDDLRLLEMQLFRAVGLGEKGCNVLLYGLSGTGKTQLARALAAAIGAELFEVRAEGGGHDRYGAPRTAGERLHPEARLDAYQLSQRLLARRHGALILFDEIEDVFPAGLRGLLNRSHPPKAWLSDLLESNPVPAIWVSNSIWQLDPAVVRRFTLVVEMGNPTRAVRLRLLRDALAESDVREAWVAQMAENPHLSPALIAKAGRFTEEFHMDTAEELEAALERILGNSLQAMGLPRRSRLAGRALTRYRLDCLNPDQDLRGIADGLGRTGRGRLCLYGPPGTGKTAFAEHVARTLDRPLHVRRASDLLSKWLGETEQHIAAMFRAAEQEQAVLLLDEADGFLRERAGAHHAWEVTQVNELLTQMEDFEGVFIAATNLMETLDAAALRRFDLKVRFDYLAPAQAARLFEQVLTEQGSTQPLDDLTREHLSRLDRLTPGDFAAVIRRFAITAAPWTPEALLAALRAEHQGKPGAVRRPIGFATSA